MKNKGKVQFVQQFRKITAIQKLPTLKQGFGDIFFQNKADNNKFLRLKDQPLLTQIQINYRNQSFCQNDFIKTYCSDQQDACKVNVQTRITCLNQEVQSYKKWSYQLTEYIKQPKYTYKFKLQKASPPVALSKQLNNFDPLALQLANSPTNKINKNKKSTNEQPSQTSTLLQNKKKRFDFNQITNYLISDDYKFQDLQGNIDLVKKQMQHFRQYKNIRQINKIEQLKADYDKFQYSIKLPVDGYTDKQKLKQSSLDVINNMSMKNGINNVVEDQLNLSTSKKRQNSLILPPSNPMVYSIKNFKHLSILQSKLDFHINFFRDLGTPARTAEEFIKIMFLDEDQEMILNEDQNPFIRQKIDTYLLHYLQPNQLKIDKNVLSFNDLQNISMSRVTSTNAHMCIRSEKVTRGQYEKLLRKMQKLYKMQHQDGKTRQNKQVSTDQIIEDNNRNSKNQNVQKSMSIHKIVQELNSIRKQAYAIRNQDEKSFKLLNQRLFNDQISKKMFALLQQLYQRVCQQLPLQYSILQIGFHIDEVNGLAEQYYQKKKLIWFIMTVLQQIQKGKSLQKNITYLNNKSKKQDEPKIIKYKGQKAIARDRMGTKNLYYNNPVANSTNKERSISPLTRTNYLSTKSVSKTPVKNTSNTANKTPLKYISPSNQTVSNKKSVSPIKTTAPKKNSYY